MERQTFGTAAAEEGHDIVHTAHPKEYEVLPLGGEERTEQGIFVELERRPAMPGSQPRGPGSDQGEPPAGGQH